MFHNFDPIYLGVLLATIIISLSVHEFMHALVGYKLGDLTASEEGRLSLNPLKHIDPLMTVALPIVSVLLFGQAILAAKPVPFDPRYVKYDEYGSAMIAAAGPLSNLALAILGGLVLHFGSFNTTVSGSILLFITTNVSIFVFNLIPIPPLDGSRVLYAFAPDAVRRVFDQLEPYGFFIVFGLVLYGGSLVSGTLRNLNQSILQLIV